MKTLDADDLDSLEEVKIKRAELEKERFKLAEKQVLIGFLCISLPIFPFLIA